MDNTSSSRPAVQERPWYREFWVWVVIALPLSVVIAGTATAVIAINGADALVVDDFQKVGLVARREGAQEFRAEELNVVVTASIDRDSGQVTARLQGDVTPSALRIGLHHPTRRDLDRSATLLGDESGLYRGNIGEDLQGHWYLRITDADNGWRIRGKLRDDQQLLELNGSSR